jgi:hypothetical protein
VEEPETTENPTQSFEIHNIVWRRTQLLAVIICIRNFVFDSLKYMNRDKEEKGIVARDCLPLEPRCLLPRQRGSGGRQSQATMPFSSMSCFSLLQIDVEVEEPETSENSTQSFEIHNIFWRRTQLLAVIIYII